MGQHYLKPLFAPKTVAIFGASERVDSVGQIVFHNMLQSGFQGTLYAINPKHAEVQGYKTYASLFQISETVELAIIATPAQTVPEIIDDCGKHGVRGMGDLIPFHNLLETRIPDNVPETQTNTLKMSA